MRCSCSSHLRIRYRLPLLLCVLLLILVYTAINGWRRTLIGSSFILAPPTPANPHPSHVAMTSRSDTLEAAVLECGALTLPPRPLSHFGPGRLRWLVLDEADRLLDLGMEPRVREILKLLAGRQVRAWARVLVGYG
jgi:hypothetical protein